VRPFSHAWIWLISPIFTEATPISLIKALRPDLLIKGADYNLDQVVGADFVQSYGGTILLAELKQGFSTTDMITRMNARYQSPVP